MTTLVTLPGLDGSPYLQGALPAALQRLAGARAINHQCLAYPPQAPMGYTDLADWARPQLPQDRPFVLLAESFGGPLALLLAGCGQGSALRAPPAQLQGVVLAASFVGAAVPWAAPLVPLLQRAPARAMLAIPPALWHWWLLGRWATPALRTALQQALRHTPPHVLRHRALQALQPPRLDVSALTVPLLVLRAAQDRLLPASGLQAFAAAPRCQMRTVDGPHMLLQAVPDACAPAIASFMQDCCAK